MSKTESAAGRAVLMAAHCAGMIDLVTLPVWVGTLMSAYRFDPQQAGALVTCFLAGAVVASLFFAPRFHRVAARPMAALAYGVAALAFFGVTLVDGFELMAALHAMAGLAAGCGLSFTHGSIGRSANPHRLFAMAGLALGVFAIPMLGGLPALVSAAGGAAMFHVFAGVMAVAALLAALAFPSVRAPAGSRSGAPATPLRPTAWRAMAGVACLALVQAMLFSFVERIGNERFGPGAVASMLIVLGFVTLLPAPLAALLQRRLAPQQVLLAGPATQVLIALVITQSTGFLPFAAAVILLPCVMIFSHTFAFGAIARLDPSGRAVAATPAMTMIGAAIGPILGGTLVKAGGYTPLAIAAALIAAVSIACFLALLRPQDSGASLSLENGTHP
ncbi:MFS transporter [Roseateles cellulosilyticus]|uniref:MFS transporter n=1 Tax=Pelomonas cellulosilytica TaxID=2906762 RepID=A0ABS8Y0K7_9BURK|nr:MFS transporter [Pelomonas sp. P8]MCE4556587.1 MFS transporter [Pelomonas sp. P8]